MLPRFSTYLLTILFITSLFFTEQATAGKVVKVKGKKVFIMLDPEEVDSTQNGDKLLLTTPNGKKRALVMVRNKRGNKVIAQLGKGKAAKGLISMPHSGGKKKSSPSIDDYEPASDIARDELSSGQKKKSDLRFGIMAGFGTATQNVTDVADMSGSTMAFKGLIDYTLFGGLGIRGRIGMDMFSVTGSAGSIEYQTDINYLTVDMLLRYNIVDSSSFGLFVNGGVGIYSPMSSDLGQNPAILEDSISTTSLLIVGLGASIPIGSMELFIGADYLYFPPSDDVSTSAISGKLGLLFGF
jgi:hypothetical protein